MAGNERGALSRSLIAALDTAFPLHDSPAVEAVLREFRENTGEVHLPIAERAEASCPFDPGLVAAVDTLSPRRVKLRVLHVKHFDAIVIEINELQIIELLQHEMAGIEQHIA